MRKVLLGAFVLVSLLVGCDGGSGTKTGAGTPPSKEIQTKNQKGKLVADTLPPPP